MESSRSASPDAPVDVVVVAIPETVASTLYGMVEVLQAAGNIWQALARDDEQRTLFHARIVSPDGSPFTCGNGIPVHPELSLTDDPDGSIVVLPELWLGADDHLLGRYPELMSWIRSMHRDGASIYAAGSGSVMLAETGLLDGCDTASHWACADLFHDKYPAVRFQPERILAFADTAGLIVTSGGGTSWHDLVIHIISKHANPDEALRIAQVCLLKPHAEGQLPYAPLTRRHQHEDDVVHECEERIRERYADAHVLQSIVDRAQIPERTLKRRFRAATGASLIAYVQNLRVENAKRLLEAGELPVDEISAATGYEDASFFRRLFKRRTGLTPSEYRKLFRPILDA